MRFKRAFQLTSEVNEFSDAENVERLYDALTGSARDAVEGLMVTSASAVEIIDILDRRFGNPDLVVDKIARDLKRLPSLGVSGMTLITFASKVEVGVAALKERGHAGHWDNPELLRELLGKLPSALLYDYDKFNDDSDYSEPRLIALSRFLTKRAEMSRLSGTSAVRTNKDFPRNDKDGRNIVRTVCANITGSEINKSKDNFFTRNCVYCEVQGHTVNDCRKFDNLNVSKRWDWVKTSRRCFSCLDNSHQASVCKFRKVCTIDGCHFAHHILLHHVKSDTNNRNTIHRNKGNRYNSNIRNDSRHKHRAGQVVSSEREVAISPPNETSTA